MAIKGGKRLFLGKSGFTLIELLVVVLIIGILAAVALPQYKLAVEKSRVVQLLAALKPLAEAEETYYLEHGTYTTYVNQLDIGYPYTTETFTLKNGAFIGLGAATNRIYGLTKHVEISYFTRRGIGQASTYHKPGMMICATVSTDKIGTKICKSLSGGVVVEQTYMCGLSQTAACTSYLLRK